MSQMQGDANADEVERYLYSNIPLAADMGVRVEVAGPEQVLLRAPLAPNINHHRTVFGGSGVAVATLAAWTLLHLRLREAAIAAELVIQRSSMDYGKPIPGDFTASCTFTDDEQWRRFRTTLERRGRARMTVSSQLLYQQETRARFVGEFVALRPGESGGPARCPPSP